MIDCVFFFFKQKTAYEMRISDWSSDVCSSDLGYRAAFIDAAEYRSKRESKGDGDDNKDNKRDLKLETLAAVLDGDILVHIHCYRADEMEIGRASCRERVCQYV